MKFEVGRYGINVIPQDEADEAYIEDTLGLKKEGDYVLLTRENAMGMSCIAYLRTKHQGRKCNMCHDIFCRRSSPYPHHERCQWPHEVCSCQVKA